MKGGGDSFLMPLVVFFSCCLRTYVVRNSSSPLGKCETLSAFLNMKTPPSPLLGTITKWTLILVLDTRRKAPLDIIEVSGSFLSSLFIIANSARERKSLRCCAGTYSGFLMFSCNPVGRRNLVKSSLVRCGESGVVTFGQKQERAPGKCVGSWIFES